MLRGGLVIETRLYIRIEEVRSPFGVSHHPVITEGQDMVGDRALSCLKATPYIGWVDTPRVAYGSALARVVKGYVI